MHGSTANESFLAEVIESTPGAETLITCLQCGTCGGSCPSGPDMESHAAQVVRLGRQGEGCVPFGREVTCDHGCNHSFHQRRPHVL